MGSYSSQLDNLTYISCFLTSVWSYPFPVDYWALFCTGRYSLWCCLKNFRLYVCSYASQMHPSFYLLPDHVCKGIWLYSSIGQLYFTLSLSLTVGDDQDRGGDSGAPHQEGFHSGAFLCSSPEPYLRGGLLNSTFIGNWIHHQQTVLSARGRRRSSRRLLYLVSYSLSAVRLFIWISSSPSTYVHLIVLFIH